MCTSTCGEQRYLTRVPSHYTVVKTMAQMKPSTTAFVTLIDHERLRRRWRNVPSQVRQHCSHICIGSREEHRVWCQTRVRRQNYCIYACLSNGANVLCVRAMKDERWTRKVEVIHSGREETEQTKREMAEEAHTTNNLADNTPL